MLAFRKNGWKSYLFVPEQFTLGLVVPPLFVEELGDVKSIKVLDQCQA